jgi:hypothetical protein
VVTQRAAQYSGVQIIGQGCTRYHGENTMKTHFNAALVQAMARCNDEECTKSGIDSVTQILKVMIRIIESEV